MNTQRIKQQRARTPKAKEELRDRILREAVALFVAEGYAGFSMRNLAKRLDYTATALYAYFENKDELVLAIIEQGYELLSRHIAAVEGDSIAALDAIGEAFMDFAFRNPQLYTLMFIHRPGTLFDLSPQVVQSRMALLGRVAEAARHTLPLAEERDESVRQIAELFFALNHGLISLALTLPVYDESWARRGLAFLLEALRPALEERGELKRTRLGP